MISFNSNSSLFRISFNFVNTCYFFVICSFSPKKHHYKENLRDGTNLSTRTEHPVPNAVSPRRFHCTLIMCCVVKKMFSAQSNHPNHLGRLFLTQVKWRITFSVVLLHKSPEHLVVIITVLGNDHQCFE